MLDPAGVGRMGILQQAGLRLYAAPADADFSSGRGHGLWAGGAGHGALPHQWSPQGFGWSAAAGFVNFMGFLAFFAAIEKGKVSTVIAMSSLYPVITIVLSVLFLQEKISPREGLGIACALLAGFLLAG